MPKAIPICFLILITLSGCAQKSETMPHKYTNALINETSPYLLQHAHNPVNWEPWGPKASQRARDENKLLLVSIGYAACHWCHVMEAECFEDEEVAKLMNEHFVSIKIDREERPDVDQIYMDAVQMMTGSGGWPLNVVALPDGRPFWGATYVRREEWMRVLNELQGLYHSNPGKVTEYAQKMEEGIKAVNLVEPKPESEPVPLKDLARIMDNWSSYFDTKMGGYKQAPKFMMPVNLDYFLHYATARKDEKLLKYVNTTLTKMAWGGVYDQLGGGFSRYSVDAGWHIPHFEKMLYDNGQLISLYSRAYAATGNNLYRKVVEESIAFVSTELMDSSYGFYSSLDADSENENGALEEGAYYVWTREEIKQLLGDDYDVFSDYYNINAQGLWEGGKYVLIRNAPDKDVAKQHSLSENELHRVIETCKGKLLERRNSREKPRLDDKILTSWNGLMLSGLVNAFRYLGERSYLDLALKNAAFIKQRLIREDGSIVHNYKKGKNSINGYLEDYATVAEAFMGLYEATLDETWLTASRELLDHCVDNFRDEGSGMFFFTSLREDYLIRRTIETADNVIPSSNSVIANTLWKMSRYFPDAGYDEIAKQMLHTIQDTFYENASAHANWQHLALFRQYPFYEIASVGEDYLETSRELQAHYLPNAVFAGTSGKSGLPLLQNRYVEGSTLIYVCQYGSCKLPVSDPAKALSQLEEVPPPGGGQ